MSEIELETTIEHRAWTNGPLIDWWVTIYWEYDGGIHINSVYAMHEEDDTDYWPEGLTEDQREQARREVQEHHALLCDRAEAQAEDCAEWRYQAAKENV